ncbi:unnamed protein product [Urochloa humidicola]
MAARRCVMATRASEIVGFPALLNELLKTACFIHKPEYEVFARGYAIGLDEYMARLHLGERVGERGKTYVFEAMGTSAEMAVHEVARGALAYLRTSSGNFGKRRTPSSRYKARVSMTFPTSSLHHWALLPKRSGWRRSLPPMSGPTGALGRSWMKQEGVFSIFKQMWNSRQGSIRHRRAC